MNYKVLRVKNEVLKPNFKIIIELLTPNHQLLTINYKL